MKKIIFLALMSLSVANVLSLAVVSGSASAQVSSGINAATTQLEIGRASCRERV